MNYPFAIIKRWKLWLLIAGLLSAGSIAMFFWTVRYSIQFTGGMEFVVSTKDVQPSVQQDIEGALSQAWYKDFSVGLWSKDGYASILIQTDVDSNEVVEQIAKTVTSTLLAKQVIPNVDAILEQSVIGPSVGDYITKSAQKALIWGMVFMGAYILFAFAGMRDFVSPGLLGLITVLTMIFDIIVPSGAYGVLMGVNQAVQVDMIFIVGLLTIMGYSINDTIIILDRVRENFFLHEGQLSKGKISRADIFEMSVWQTMRRSIGTSMTTFLVVIIMYVFGTGVLKMFAFTLAFGVLSWSYSSIFVAIPLTYLWSGGEKAKLREKTKDPTESHREHMTHAQTSAHSTHSQKKRK